ncbi:MAG: PilZ domain-containing protein [Candidatus Sulfotelmatobacter sp.]
MTDKIYNYGYRSPRFRSDFRFLLQTGGRSPALLNGRCTDLSEDGLAAEIDALLEVGEQVLLIATLPGTSSSIRISARVTNRQISSYGFAFIFTSQNQRSLMHEYIESRRARALNSRGFSE